MDNIQKEQVIVRAHERHYSNGKVTVVCSHLRKYNGLTEINTKQHKKFVESYLTFLFKEDKYNSCKKEVCVGDGRCDILIKTDFKYNTQKICVGCQLSDIPKVDIFNRTFNYLNLGYDVQWVIITYYNEEKYNDLILYFNRFGCISTSCVTMKCGKSTCFHVFEINHNSEYKFTMLETVDDFENRINKNKRSLKNE